ncbi:UNVERIFIED_CONTAM: hypothetical protein K2H54_003757 [Gekko kuhli]
MLPSSKHDLLETLKARQGYGTRIRREQGLHQRILGSRFRGCMFNVQRLHHACYLVRKGRHVLRRGDGSSRSDDLFRRRYRPRFRVLFRLAFEQRQRPIEVVNVTVQEIPPYGKGGWGAVPTTVARDGDGSERRRGAEGDRCRDSADGGVDPRCGERPLDVDGLSVPT